MEAYTLKIRAGKTVKEAVIEDIRNIAENWESTIKELEDGSLYVDIPYIKTDVSNIEKLLYTAAPEADSIDTAYSFAYKGDEGSYRITWNGEDYFGLTFEITSEEDNADISFKTNHDGDFIFYDMSTFFEDMGNDRLSFPKPSAEIFDVKLRGIEIYPSCFAQLLLILGYEDCMMEKASTVKETDNSDDSDCPNDYIAEIGGYHYTFEYALEQIKEMIEAGTTYNDLLDFIDSDFIYEKDEANLLKEAKKLFNQYE